MCCKISYYLTPFILDSNTVTSTLFWPQIPIEDKYSHIILNSSFENSYK
jgi:hypothetical protein